MLLNDVDLERALETGEIGLDPYDPVRIQPSSVDMTLGTMLSWPLSPGLATVDLMKDCTQHAQTEEITDYFDLHAREFILATTHEVLRLPNHYAARVEGKSSLGRLGLLVHATAGFIDPGFEGQVTLELCNLLDRPIRLYPYMPVAQLAVFQMSGPAAFPYKGKYQGQIGPQVSRYHQNF